jgi:hypothetical protein
VCGEERKEERKTENKFFLFSFERKYISKQEKRSI